MRAILALALLAAAALAPAAIAQDEAAAPDATTSITRLILVPAGEFTMGRAGDLEMPAHRVRVDAFLLDEHEVTNAQYQAFCDATGAALPVFWGVEKFRCGDQWPDHPVVGVYRGAAMKYAEWVGKRLPTEAEWEYAAGGGEADLRFGTADTLSGAMANYKKSARGGTAPVMSYPPNALGLYDLIGNVREWVVDYHGGEVPADAVIPEAGEGSLDHVTPLENPVNLEKARLGIVKAGGWFSGAGCNSAYERNGYPVGWSDFNVGFRCARDVDR